MNALPDQGGFTLIEVMIALALFALIAMAGVALVESTIGVQDRTQLRLDRIAEMRRANYIIGLDLDQVEPGDFAGQTTQLHFRRHGFRGLPGVGKVTYSLSGGVMRRSVDGGPAQSLLTGVTHIRFRYFKSGRGWAPAWNAPSPETDPLPDGIMVEAVVSGGTFRRAVALPRP